MEAYTFSIPLRMKFRGILRREGMLLRGPGGWGEFSPFAEYSPQTCARWLSAALEAARGDWPTPLRTSIPVNVTVPAVEPQRAFATVRASGCSTAKVKVAEPGQSEKDDIERIEAVREALGPQGSIRVDANGKWTVEQAVQMINRLDQYGLQYVEQPCATLDELAAVRRRVSVPVAADEVVRLADDPLRVKGLRAAADVVILKVQPLGGVRAALRVAEVCGLPTVVSSALETSVGLSAGAALASALPELPYACGLATTLLLDADIVTDRLIPVAGHIPASRPSVDLEVLEGHRMSPERAAWWYSRLEAAGSVIDFDHSMLEKI